MSDDLITTAEAAKILGVSSLTVRMWTTSEDLPVFRLSGRTLRFSRSAVLAWMRERAANLPPSTEDTA